MTEIYLIRHGETRWNSEGRFQGKLDSPLTDKGNAQVRACGQRLARLDVGSAVLVVSPLGRTRQTAKIIAECASIREMRFDDRIAEVSIGAWDGLTHVDIDHQWPGLMDGATAFDWYFRSPDGENYDAAVSRVASWLDDIRRPTIAVSHGLIGRIIRGVYAGLAREEALKLPVPQDVIWQLKDGKIIPINVD